MRVAFFTEGYDPFTNGAIVLVKQYRQQLEDLGHEVVVFAPEHPEFRDDDDHVVRLPSIAWSRQAYPSLRPFSGLGRQFDRWRFDLIHSHHPFSMGLAAERLARRSQIPLVHTFHTMLPDFACYAPVARTLIGRALTSVVRRHCAHTRCVTVTNYLMRDWLVERGVRTPIAIVPPAVCLPRPEPGARWRIRAGLGVKGDTVVLLYVGRLAPEKNLDFLLRSVARLDRRRDWRLVLVGPGPEGPHLRDLSSLLGLADRVTLTGGVAHSAVQDYNSAGDISVLSSLSETFGLVILEAMSVGLPCIAVGINGPLAVVENGTTGILTLPDEQSFAAAVESLIRDRNLRQTMGRASKNASLWYSTERASARLIDAYRLALPPGMKLT
ncbi:MAG: glycosyltransferase [Armatimonadetes bacterium]|nr:glycosyltransferase [Armatimonadota bacterium]